MLCHSCQRRQTCLPVAMAQRDQQVGEMLANLEHCDRKITRPSFLKIIWEFLTQPIRQWRDRYRNRSTPAIHLNL